MLKYLLPRVMTIQLASRRRTRIVRTHADHGATGSANISHCPSFAPTARSPPAVAIYRLRGNGRLERHGPFAEPVSRPCRRWIRTGPGRLSRKLTGGIFLDRTRNSSVPETAPTM